MILDCDPGIGPGLDADDPLAILLVLASKELELEGITTVFGNVEVARATNSALCVLEAAGRTDITVAMGMSGPLSGSLHSKSIEEYRKHIHWIGPIQFNRIESSLHQLHAIDFIVSKAREKPGEITIIAVGPLTNVAMAILKEPSLKQYIKGITIMGGAIGADPIFGRGNITPVAEYNIWHDPLAAKIVFESGIPLTMVGLDVTNPNKGTILLEEQLLKLVEKKTAFTEFLYELCKTYIDEPKFNWNDQGQNRRGCVLYDPVAVAATINPSLVTTRKMIVRVETKGDYAEGQTIADLTRENDQSNCDVCVDVDGERFVQLFLTRIASLI